MDNLHEGHGENLQLLNENQPLEGIKKKTPSELKWFHFLFSFWVF